MKQNDFVNIIETLTKNVNCDKSALIKMFQLFSCYNNKGELTGLAFHEYRFVDGPFKGQRFISTAAKIEWLNKFNNLRVIFTGGKLDGIETISLICFDRKIEKVKPEWQPLLSISLTI